jgi:hypothetical protein
MLDDIRNQKRVLEARNVNLARENKKINEHYRMLAEQVKGQSTLTEARKEKIEAAKNATGKGTKVTKEEIKVIREHNGEVPQQSQSDDDTTLDESFDAGYMQQMRVLAGVKKQPQAAKKS